MTLLEEIVQRPTITPVEASQILSDHGVKCTAEKIRMGLEQKRYPFGEAVHMPKSWAYTIYTRMFIAWLNERLNIHIEIDEEETTL